MVDKISDVLLICPTSHRSAISNYIQSDTASSFQSLRIDLQTYDEGSDVTVGTCTILRHFSPRIQQDFVVLPCDFVPPPALLLSQLLNKFRTDATNDGSLATACFFDCPTFEKGTSVEEWGPLPSSVPIAWDRKTSSLLYVETPDDIDRNPDELELRTSLLNSYAKPEFVKCLRFILTYY